MAGCACYFFPPNILFRSTWIIRQDPSLVRTWTGGEWGPGSGDHIPGVVVPGGTTAVAVRSDRPPLAPPAGAGLRRV